MAKKTQKKATANQNPTPAPESPPPVSQTRPEQSPETPPAGDQTRPEQQRRDQVRCPSCGHYGCSAKFGTQRQGYLLIQKRECPNCRCRFRTSMHIEAVARPQVMPGWTPGSALRKS